MTASYGTPTFYIRRREVSRVPASGFLSTQSRRDDISVARHESAWNASRSMAKSRRDDTSTVFSLDVSSLRDSISGTSADLGLASQAKEMPSLRDSLTIASYSSNSSSRKCVVNYSH